MRAVVFDLDDTLYLERDYVFSGFDAVAEWAEATLDIPYARAYRDLTALFERGVRGTTFDDWLRQLDVNDPGLTEQVVAVYRSHTPRIRPSARVRELLMRLRRSYVIGLITDGSTAVQRAKLRALGLEAAFDATLVTDELGLGRAGWKPSRLPFEEMLRRLDVVPGEAVYVADNPTKDFIAPNQLGMTSIRVRSEFGVYSTLEPASPEAAPTIEVDSLDRLEEALGISVRA